MIGDGAIPGKNSGKKPPCEIGVLEVIHGMWMDDKLLSSMISDGAIPGNNSGKKPRCEIGVLEVTPGMWMDDKLLLAEEQIGTVTVVGTNALKGGIGGGKGGMVPHGSLERGQSPKRFHSLMSENRLKRV